jgi:class 3 adenylate cyclase
MKSTNTNYDFAESRSRIDEILEASEGSFEELKSIPSRDRLTFTNGFYVQSTALFVDIRKSSDLPNKYKHPTLAKIYRSYISEVAAIINSDDDCKEVTIEGDSVWGIFDTPYQNQIDNVISIAAQVSSLLDTLNCKYKKKGIDPLIIGIGIDYGTALMIKAGYKGSTINDVVWMGEVVGSAAKLCNYGNQTYNDRETMISYVIFNNLNDEYKKLFTYNNLRDCYHGDIVNRLMNNWIKENC